MLVGDDDHVFVPELRKNLRQPDETMRLPGELRFAAYVEGAAPTAA